ncbi:hypothetical protein CDD83_5176 [Cordyceps sp. RAO-2017]|nr:hypothetical protein CDD83_5176 [Cordyceps sp. RAO-2017]
MLHQAYGQLLLAAAAGLAAHGCYFVRGEHDLAAARIARLHLAAAALVAGLKWQCQGLALRHALAAAVALAAAYAAALFASILVFRLFLSPLRRMPGPLRLRCTKLTHMWDMACRRNCELLHELHREYGDVVRTGPNEVAVFGLDAYRQIHGPESRCGRAAYYDIVHPMVSLDTTRDDSVHAHRRKLWDQAFSIKSLEQAEPIIASCAGELAKQLRQREGQPLDMSVWLEHYTFDVMGLFGLTIDFRNLADGEHPLLALFHMAHRLLGPLAAVPWLKHLLMGIPFVERMKYYREFFTWADLELHKNIGQNQHERRNIIGYVLADAERNGGIEANWNFVLGDFVLVIIAGSDPVRQVLVNMLFYLTQHPEHLHLLRQELASPGGRTQHRLLQGLPHLNAVVYETLRLNPAVPSAGLRLPPRGGVAVNGVWIPENTTIVTPQYSLMRDERYFDRPEEWIPERFTTRPELILNKDAFVPWSIGRRSCIGKNLSLMEIRVAAALLLTEFDFEFAPGEDGTDMFARATDYFTTTPGPLRLIPRIRKRPESEQDRGEDLTAKVPACTTTLHVEKQEKGFEDELQPEEQELKKVSNVMSDF